MNINKLSSFKRYISNIVLIFISVIFSLILCELIARIISPFDIFSKKYPLSLYHNELSTSQPQKFDLALGYVYKNSYYHPSHPNFGSNLSEDKQFFEKNNYSEPAFNAGNAIIATGDSFVAGNEVGNNETWPAILEKRINIRVLNGGVGGYSFTQAELMGERLAKEKKVKHLIVSLIPEDLIRGEYSIYQGVPRPYFVKQNNKLYLYSDHIKEFNNFSVKDKKYMEDIIKKYSWSFLIMEIIKRTYTNPEVFYYFGLQKKAGVRFDVVGCNLVNRLEKVIAKNNIKAAILIQYPDFHFYDKKNKQLDYINRYLGNFKMCVKNSNLLLLDMEDRLKKVYQANKEEFHSLYVDRRRHMSAKGNKFTAEFIAPLIQSAWYK